MDDWNASSERSDGFFSIFNLILSGLFSVDYYAWQYHLIVTLILHQYVFWTTDLGFVLNTEWTAENGSILSAKGLL